MLDGQLADVDKPFKSELGDIMYPGDPKADPSNVYNCRCTIAARVVSIDGIKVGEDGQEHANRRTARYFYNEDPEKFDKTQKMLYNESAAKKQYNKYIRRCLNTLAVVSEKVFCPIFNREIEEGYCWELCNIGTDKILLKGDKVDDWDEAQLICKKCGRYED